MLASRIESINEFRNSVMDHFTCEWTVEWKMHSPFPHSINKFKMVNSKLNQEQVLS